MKNKNVVFMGTPDFAVPVLKMLIEKTNVIMVVTKPDKRVGRNKELTFSPVKKVALENNIPVFQPIKIKNDYEKLTEEKIDLIVTCAYGQIIPKEVLNLPKYGCINVHASILPKYRGSAPIQWAIINGDKETGVTIMYMDEGMDTGDIISISKIAISSEDNVGTMHDKLSILGAQTLEKELKSIFDGSVIRIKQGDNWTLAPMIKREDEHLNFNDYGENIINRIRAFNPWPLANTLIDNKEIKIIEAEFKNEKIDKAGSIIIDKEKMGISCLDGIVYLKKVKPFGKKEMSIESFLNGINKKEYIKKVVS